MNVPQKADKWIVFGLLLLLSVADGIRSHFPGESPTVIAVVVIPLALTALLTAFFLIWRAACRLITRLLLIPPTPGNVRTFANVSFLLIIAALVAWMFVPVMTVTGTIEVPVKMDDPTPSSAQQPH